MNIKHRLSVIAIAGLLGGVLLTPLLLRGIPLMRQMTDSSQDRFGLVLVVSLGSSLLFVPGLLAYTVVAGRGTAVLTQLIVGLVMGILTSYFGDVFFSNALTGVLLELAIWLFAHHRPSTYRSMSLVGLFLAVLASVGSLIGHGALGLTSLSLGIIGLSCLITFVLLAWLLQFVGEQIRNLEWFGVTLGLE